MNNTLVLNPPAFVSHFFPRKINLKIFWILNFLFVISLLVFYIFQTNSIIFEGYQIKNFQEKLDGITKENRILEINYAQAKSLENIEKKVRELGFERIGKINYFQVLENSVAVK